MSKEQPFEENDPVQRHYFSRSASGIYGPGGGGPTPQYVGVSQRFPSRPSSTFVTYPPGSQDTPFFPVRRESTTEPPREPQPANISVSEDSQPTGIAPKPTSAGTSQPPLETYITPETPYNTSQRPDRLPKSHPNPTPLIVEQEDQHRSHSLHPPKVTHTPFIPPLASPYTAPQRHHLFGTRPAHGINTQAGPTGMDPPIFPPPTSDYTRPPAGFLQYGGGQVMDYFVANDPFRSHKNAPDTSNLTFDSIPAMDLSSSDRRYPTPAAHATYPSYMDPYYGQHYYPPPMVPHPPYPPFSQPYPSHDSQNQPLGYAPPVIPGGANGPYSIPAGTNPTANEAVPGEEAMHAPARTSLTANGTTMAEPLPTIIAGRPYASPRLTYSTLSTPDSTTKLSPEEPERREDLTPEYAPHPQVRLSPVRRTEDAEQSPTSAHNDPGDDPHRISPSESPNGYRPHIQAHGIDAGEKRISFWSALGKPFFWPFARAKPSPKYEHRPPFGYPPGFMLGVNHAAQSQESFSRAAVEFVVKTVPTQVYLHVLLRLPSLYFSRVARIFEEADLTLPELKKMALETMSSNRVPRDSSFLILESTNVPPQYLRLKSTWEAFIDSVMREWKTFNLISVLLLSAILTILQIESAAQDPITRYTALSSLICALISLLFGCMYIIRFGSMRKTYKAAEWALEAQRTRTTIWWNVWVLLAMPAVWLTWSITLYIACIMSFLWRTSSQDNSPPMVMSKTALLTVRIVISSVLGLGLFYTAMILSTFSRYGDTMDKAWMRRINGWIQARESFGRYAGHSNPYKVFPHSMQPYPLYSAYPPYSTYPPYLTYPPYSTYLYPDYPTYPTGATVYAPSAPPSTSSPTYEKMQNDAYGYPTDRKNQYSNVDSPTTPLSSSRPHPFGDLKGQSYPSRRNSGNSIPSTDMNSMYMPYPGTSDPRNSHRPTSESQRKDSTDRKSTHTWPNYTIPNLPPQAAEKTYAAPIQHPKGARTKRRLSVPPPDTLPTIPGTPGSSNLSYLASTVQNSSPTSLKYDTPTGLGIQYGERLVEEPQIEPQPDLRVHFSSPLVSPQESLFAGGSGREALESERSSVSEPTTMSTNVPWTPFPSPISPAD